MTDLRTAAQQALEALEADNSKLWSSEKRTTAITALRAALAQQAEPVEPVAWYQKRGQEVLTSHPACWGREDEHWTPLYTAPPQRKPLTKERLLELYNQLPNWGMDMDSLPQGLEKFARIVERAHGIGEQP